MPFNMQHATIAKNLNAKQTQRALPASAQKAAGTRYGVLIDWRGGSTASGKPSGRYGRSLRDGR